MAGCERVERLKERPGTTNTCSTNRRLITQRNYTYLCLVRRGGVYRGALGTVWVGMLLEEDARFATE